MFKKMNVLPIVCIVLYWYQGVNGMDPCIDHRKLPTYHKGSRNEMCPTEAATGCDYYLPENWYVVEEGTILSKCPVNGTCGVTYPAWMNGTFPTEADGIVNRTVCVKGTTGCCMDTLDIMVLRCPLFYVYYLRPFNYCPAAYCVESILPCPSPTTQPTTKQTDVTTDNPCINHRLFPTYNLGSRNEKCSVASVNMCDSTLQEAWYTIMDGTLLSHCPHRGTCGVENPAWINGTLPAWDDGTVHRILCIKGATGCCHDSIDIMVRRCPIFYAYYLKPVKSCQTAYCVDSNMPCDAHTTEPVTSPQDGSSSQLSEETRIVYVVLYIGLGLAIGIVSILIVFAIRRWSKKNSKCGLGSEDHKTGKTVTSSVISTSDYMEYVNIPACYTEHGGYENGSVRAWDL